MTQNEFLDALRRALNGQVPAGSVTENLNYYQSYIRDEMRKGRSEQEILDELGDPRLIARTIIDASGGTDQRTGSGSEYNSYGYSYGESADPAYDQDTQTDDGYGSFHQKNFRISKWMILGILFIVLLVVFSILFFAFRTIFHLLFSFHGLWFWIIILIIIYALSRRR